MAEEMGVPKTNDLKIAFSRDGFHWDRGSTDEFIPSERNNTAWDKGYIHAAGGTCLIVKDRLYFYYGAWSGLSPNLKGNTVGSHRRSNAMYAGGATGLATLRRDGFASMDSGRSGASLITHPVKFSGNYLFVNCDSSRGELEVEILDNYGDVIHPYTADNCVTLSCDSSKQIVKWSGVKDPGRGECDISAAGMMEYDDRHIGENAVWSDPYMVVTRSLLIRRSDVDILKGPEDFRGRKIVVTPSSSADIDGKIRYEPAGANIIPFVPSQDEIVSQLLSGEIDAFGEGDVSNEYLAGKYVDENGEMVLALTDLHSMNSPELLRFCVRSVDANLPCALNEFIKKTGNNIND